MDESLLDLTCLEINEAGAQTINSLQDMHGVYKVNVDYERKRISIVFDAKKTTADDLVTLLLSTGFVIKRFNLT